MAEEQLYGRAETEASQGYLPMPEPAPDKHDPELELVEAAAKWADGRARETSPIVERQYFDEADRPQAPNKVIELDRAAKDLAEIRQLEKTLADADAEERLAAEIDEARGLKPHEPDQSVQEVLQAEQTPLVSELQQQSAPMDGIDPDVAAAFQNPKILAVLEQQHLQNTAKVESAVNQAAEWAQQNAAVAVAAIIARPELQGVPPGQYAGALQALKVSNPTAYAEIGRQIANTQAVLQQATQAQQMQHQRYATAFQEWSNAQDDVFERSVANEPPETVKALRQTAMQMMREAGLTDQQLAHEWNTNALLRSAPGQSLLADAARWRMLKAGIKPAPKPVPQVARPGSSMDRPDASDRDSFALEQRYQGPLTLKQAAALTVGRRARAR
jgi:hypothetical protein